jgi:hypothetical protein
MGFSLWFLFILEPYDKTLEIRHKNLGVGRKKLREPQVLLIVNFRTPCFKQRFTLKDQFGLLR